MVIANILLGLILIGVGIVLLKFNFRVSNMFSHNNVFERYMGSGATYFVMQVAAVLVIIVGFLLMSGLLDNLMGFLLSPLKDIITV